tara:strand:+ start:2651 stop:3106 length:456 start_codon:yes stop_codon:yes gene_type:complete
MAMNTVSPEDIIEKIYEKDRAFQSLGIKIVEAKSGRVKMSMRVRPDMLNCFGILHGGILFSLADSALGVAAIIDNVVSYTHTSTICFLSMVSLGEDLVAISEESTKDGRTTFYTTTVFGENNRKVAIVQGTTLSVRGTVMDALDSVVGISQ